MKIHHLNCETLHAPFVHIDSLVYCLLVESGSRLVLVDTGFGLRDYTQPTPKTRFFCTTWASPETRRRLPCTRSERLDTRQMT
ncbi:MAG: hypothetical protein R6U51_10990 [Anaerolineales bacterium]